MTTSPDPSRDLVLERVVDVPPSLVWAAWTQPDHLKRWFAPAPFSTPECEIDLRPGGMFRTVMRSPEGEEFDNVGCYLEVVENERLVFTSVLGPGFRPTVDGDLPFTAVISMEAAGEGTRYTARSRCTGMPRRPSATTRWDSKRVGARPSTSWSTLAKTL